MLLIYFLVLSILFFKDSFLPSIFQRKNPQFQDFYLKEMLQLLFIKNEAFKLMTN